MSMQMHCADASLLDTTQRAGQGQKQNKNPPMAQMAPLGDFVLVRY